MHLANYSFALYRKDMFYLYQIPGGILIDQALTLIFKGEIIMGTVTMSPGALQSFLLCYQLLCFTVSDIFCSLQTWDHL